MLCYVQVIFTAYSMSLVIVSRDANDDDDDGLSMFIPLSHDLQCFIVT